MTDTVTVQQLIEAEWGNCEIDYDPHAKPLPGICRLTCLDYPATFQFHWQVLEYLDETGTRYNRDIDSTLLGSQLKLDGLQLAPGPSGRETSLEDASMDLYTELAENFTWPGAVRDKYPRLFAVSDPAMETITLENDHGPNYRFQGEEVASTTSKTINGPGSSRWTELKLYRTQGGKLVCHEKGITCWDGERDRYAVHIASDKHELVEKVGLGSLAKDLYDEAGIDHAQDID